MSKAVEVTRIRSVGRSVAEDAVAIEEPLEIRLHGKPFSVIMRTPGADVELAAGFLLAERVIRCADDLGSIEYCAAAEASNVVDATLTDPGRADAFLAGRRQVVTSSSCGLCGRRTIESLATDADPIGAEWTIGAAALAACAERLRAGQT